MISVSGAISAVGEHLQVSKLTARQVQTAKGPGRLIDGDGLTLEISATGRKRWLIRFSSEGRVSEKALGSAEFVSLAEARDKAYQFRKNLVSGTAPARKITFGEIAKEVLASKSHLRSSTASQMGTHLRHCAPLQSKHIGSLTVDDCVALLRPLYASVPRVADRVRALMADVFSAAKVRGHFTGDNPCLWKGSLDQVLPRRPALVNHAALDWREAPALFKALESEVVVGRATQFLMLTALRKMEAVEARWAEIDGNVLTIVAERMKTSKTHRVPLSAPALAILESQRALGEISDFVFTSPRGIGKPLAPSAVNDLLGRLGITTTVHGLRTTFATWAQEQTNADPMIIEGCLAHSIGNATTRAYLRSDNLDKRAKLLSEWADFLVHSGQ
jgi:integrase